MFALNGNDLAGCVLGCGDGPASFNAEATTRGHAVVSCDPLYAFSCQEIEQRIRNCYDEVISQVRRNSDDFLWDYFYGPDHLGQCRIAAMRRFLADFEAGQTAGRYVTASLPYLPFQNSQFDLALVSHLLFLYSEQLDLQFHSAAIHELLRVAREVRIFPLLTLDRKPSPHIDPICSRLVQQGFQTEIRLVAYEFQRGGNRMLRIMHSPSTEHMRAGEPAQSRRLLPEKIPLQFHGLDKNTRWIQLGESLAKIVFKSFLVVAQ
jgi:hypothetical protein